MPARKAPVPKVCMVCGCEFQSWALRALQPEACSESCRAKRRCEMEDRRVPRTRCPQCGSPTRKGRECRSCANSRPIRWKSADQVAEALRRWSAEHEGATPSATEWHSPPPGCPSVYTVQAYFGSWASGLIAAGLTPHARHWTADEVIRAMRHWAARHGDEAPSVNDWTPSKGNPSPYVVRKLFGGWREAVVAAGLTPRVGGAPPRADGRSDARWYQRANRRMVTGGTGARLVRTGKLLETCETLRADIP